MLSELASSSSANKYSLGAASSSRKHDAFDLDLQKAEERKEKERRGGESTPLNSASS